MTTMTYSNGLIGFNPLQIEASEYLTLCKKIDGYEVIPNDRPVKLYFDVDIKYEDVESEEDGMDYLSSRELSRIYSTVLHVLSSYFGDKYDETAIAVCSSHNPYFRPFDRYDPKTKKLYLKDNYICKISFRLVVNNIIALVSHQKLLVEKINAYANTLIDADDRENIFKVNVFDPTPYADTGNQKIRSIYSNKPLENRPLKLIKGTPEMSLITAFIPPDAHLLTETIPERPIRIVDETPRDAEKDRAIFNAGIELLKPYAQSGQYEDWIRIGWAIKNTFNDSTLWHTFSKLGGKAYDRISVQDCWDNMEIREDGLGMGSIIEYMRKTDKTKTDAILSMFRPTQPKRPIIDARNILMETVNEDPDTDEETNSESSVEQVVINLWREKMNLPRNEYVEFMVHMEDVATQQIVNTTIETVVRESNSKSYETYEERYAKQTEEYLAKLLTGTHASNYIFGSHSSTPMAKWFLKCFPKKFITVKNVSYFYTGYIWKQCDKKLSELHTFIADTFFSFIVRLYAYWLNKLNSELTGATKEEDKEAIRKKILVLGEVHKTDIIKLHALQNRNELVNDIVIHSTNNDIEFNKEHHLFAFKNVIFDLRENKIIDPNPLYYISMCAGYDYDFNYPKERIDELRKLIETIHQNQEIREYYLSIISTSLTGIHPQYFFVFTGAGSNGKGSTNKLIMKTIGDEEGCYGYTAEGTLLTESIKGGSGSANQAIANMHQKRLIIAQEPKKDGKLQMDTVKRITGENQLNARGLYSTNTKTELYNTLILEANTIPKTDEVSDAVIRRLRIVPFLTKAMNKTDYELEEDKTNKCIKNTWYDDDRFRDQFKQAFFEILRPYCKAFFERGDIPEQPEICRKATNAHLAISDDMNAWILDNYEECPDATPIKLKEIYEYFKGTEAYLSLSKTAKRGFNMATFCDKLSSSPFIAKCIKMRKEYYKGKQLNADSLVGWKLKTDDDPPVDVAEEIDMVDV